MPLRRPMFCVAVMIECSFYIQIAESLFLQAQSLWPDESRLQSNHSEPLIHRNWTEQQITRNVQTSTWALAHIVINYEIALALETPNDHDLNLSVISPKIPLSRSQSAIAPPHTPWLPSLHCNSKCLVIACWSKRQVVYNSPPPFSSRRNSLFIFVLPTVQY